MGELLYSAEAKSPCSVNTAYQSLVVKGSAVLIGDQQMKREILDAVVKK